MKVVAIPVKGANFYLYSRPEFTDINSLRGKSIATGSLNGTPHVARHEDPAQLLRVERPIA